MPVGSIMSSLYSQVMNVRNHLYEQGWLKVHDFQVPIVSVGNLTMGGTGKTPIVCELLKWAQDHGIRVAMVSRGYKSEIKNIVKVPPEGSAQKYGDETALVASRFPKVPVYIGGDRVAVVNQLLASENVQIIIADDALQHRRLGRDIEIIVLDCTEDIQNYAVVPKGRGREDKSGLRRADFIILNKVNLASPEQKQKVLEFIDEICGEEIPIIESEYHVGRLVHLGSQLSAEAKGYEKVVLVLGIGNPKSFESLLNRNFDVKEHFVFRDHHYFEQKEIDEILRRCTELGVQKIIVTEKDAIKLKTLQHTNEKFWVAELTPKLSLRVKTLYEKILTHIR